MQDVKLKEIIKLAYVVNRIIWACTGFDGGLELKIAIRGPVPRYQMGL